ncbi:MAG: hypothetical protein WC683_13820 [bacterium]
MRHLKKSIITAALVIALPISAAAKKSTYIATDHRFDFVKLTEIKPSESAALGITHPSKLDEQGLKSALESVMLARSFIIKKEVDTQRVFDDGAANYLAHNMSIAFAQAKPNEKVVFSYMQKDPVFIIRNDRLNLGEAWMQGDDLHIKFKKLYAKVTGDVDKRGNESKAVARARGLRIQLELQPGQQMAVNDVEELILNINYNYAADVQKREQQAKAVPTSGKTMSGEAVVLPAGEAQAAQPVEETKSKSKSKSKAKASDAEATAAAAAAAPAASAAGGAEGGVEQRIRSLDSLRKEGLITDKEYKEKKKEILKDL